MASSFTKLNRAIKEYQNYFNHNLVEYKYVEAYKHLREGEGWPVAEFDTELYSYVKKIYNCIYVELAYQLEQGTPATELEIYDCFNKTILCLQNDGGAIENIYNKNENESIVNNASFVQDLAKRASEKVKELISLADQDLLGINSIKNQNNPINRARHESVSNLVNKNTSTGNGVGTILVNKETSLIEDTKSRLIKYKETRPEKKKPDVIPKLEPIEIHDKGYNIKVAFKQISPEEVSNVKEGIQKAMANSLYRTENRHE